MLCSIIENVRGGLMTPTSFKKAELSRRTLNFALSSTAVVEPVFSSGIFSLDLDWTKQFLLTGASDGSFYIHDTFNFTPDLNHTKKCIHHRPARTIHNRSIPTVEWFPSDNGVFTTSSLDGWLHVWDSNKLERPVDSYNQQRPNYRHQTNPVNGTIAVNTDGGVHLIDIRAGSAIQKLPTVVPIKELRWNPANERQLLVGSRGGHLIEWDVRSTLNYLIYDVDEVRLFKKSVGLRHGGIYRTCTRTPGMPQAHNDSIDSLRYSSNGQEIYSFGGDGRLRRWKTGLGSDRCLGTLCYSRKSFRNRDYQIAVADIVDPPIVFIPDGKSIYMCDMKDYRILRELVGHFQQVKTFVYDETYQVGYSGGSDAGVIVWNGNVTTDQCYLEENKIKVGRERTDVVAALQPLIDLDDDDD